jgi:hypothetical protein
MHDAPYTGCHKSTETTVLMVANRVAFQRLGDIMDPEAYATDLGRAVRRTAGTPEVPTQGQFAEGTIKTVQQHLGMEGRHLPLSAAVWGHTPDRFLRLPSDTSATGVAGPLPACVPDATAQACHTFPNTSALRMNWRHLVYTDGSAPAAHNIRPGQPVHQPTKRDAWDLVYTAPLATHKVATRRSYVYD